MRCSRVSAALRRAVDGADVPGRIHCVTCATPGSGAATLCTRTTNGGWLARSRRDAEGPERAPRRRCRLSGSHQGPQRAARSRAPRLRPHRQRAHDRHLLGDRAAHRRVRAGGCQTSRVRGGAARNAVGRSHPAVRPRVLTPELAVHAPVLSGLSPGRDSPDGVWRIRPRHSPDAVEQIPGRFSEFHDPRLGQGFPLALVPLRRTDRQGSLT